MKEIEITYQELIDLVAGDKKLELQYIDKGDRYHLFAPEGLVSWQTTIIKDSADGTDFEANHKTASNKPDKGLVKIDAPYYNNQPSIRAETRPQGTVTYFTTRGDNTALGNGTRWEWDFSNADNDVTAPTGFKRKQVDVTFVDEIWPKEGTLYFYNAVKGSYVDFVTVCPSGAFYLDRDGNPVQATEDTIVDRFVNSHPVQGSVPMGDELNTESATIASVPAGYKFRLEVTVPDTDTSSNGVCELEVFRIRTYLLPGEAL